MTISRWPFLDFYNKISNSCDRAVQFLSYLEFIDRIDCGVAFPSNLLHASCKRCRWHKMVNPRTFNTYLYILINVADFWSLLTFPQCIFVKQKRRLGREKIRLDGFLMKHIKPTYLTTTLNQHTSSKKQHCLTHQAFVSL